MSVEQPDALALLDIARETLLEQVLPQLDGDARYQVLMIANAMAMAMRELAPESPGRAEHLAPAARLLHKLYERVQTPAGEDWAASLARFARDLRNGEFDGQCNGDRQHLIRQLLRADIETRLAVSNPRRLAAGLGEVVARIDAEQPPGTQAAGGPDGQLKPAPVPGLVADAGPKRPAD